MERITVNEDVKHFLVYYTLYMICGQACSLFGIPGLYPNLISGLCLIFFCRPFLAVGQRKRLHVCGRLILFTLAFFFLTQYLSICFSEIFHDGQQILERRAVKSPSLVNAAAAGLIGPAAEEILFRRFLYKGLKPLGELRSSLISSFIFGLCHRHLSQGIYAALWGMVFCCLYEKHQSLKVPIFVHIISNLLSFTPILWLSLENFYFTVCLIFISALTVCLAVRKKGEYL